MYNKNERDIKHVHRCSHLDPDYGCVGGTRKRWEMKIGRRKHSEKKIEGPPAPDSAITGYGTINKTPAKRRSIERVYK